MSSHADSVLAKLLPTHGQYCLLALNKQENHKFQLWYDNIPQLESEAFRLNSLGYDVYFALATFHAPPEPRNPKKPWERLPKYVAGVRTLFLDVDCGYEKGYPGKEIAASELQSFCYTLGLPKPTIIESGGGLHVYWRLKKAILPATWLHLAEALKAACKEHNFSADPVVTADIVRVLRVPGTHNHKFDPPSPVLVLGKIQPAQTVIDISRLLGALKLNDFPDNIPEEFVEQSQDYLSRYQKHIANNDDVAIEELLAIIRFEFGTPAANWLQTQAPESSTLESPEPDVLKTELDNREVSFRLLLEKTQRGHGCRQIALIVTDQEHMSEPLWRAGLSIAKYSSEGATAAHRISHKYPRYSREETEEKLENIKGPYLCETFDSLNPGVCADCQHYNKIKSPIVLGIRLKESTDSPFDAVADAIPPYPNPYVRGINGGVYIRTQGNDGELQEERIYHNDIYVTERIYDEVSGEGVVIRLHLPQDGVRQFLMPLSAITSQDEFKKTLAKNGVAMTRMDRLMAYIMVWINELQLKIKASDTYRQFGWVDSNVMDKFVLGDRVIQTDGIIENPASENTIDLLPAFEPRGTLKGWKQAMEFWNRPDFECYQYVIGAGFGSILVPMTTVNCAALHLFSKETGVAKTTAMIAAMSIWGDPASLILRQDDTPYSFYNRAEVYHNLPWCIDEITNIAPRDASDLLYSFTGGRQRNRMTRTANLERARGKPWQLLAMTTGNTSLIARVSMAKLMPKAEAQRVLECEVPDLRHHFTSKIETDNFDLALKFNYGHAGEIFVKHVIKNIESVRKQMQSVNKKVDRLGKLSSENRFWSAHITASLVGIYIANELGLVKFDPERIFDWAMLHLLNRNVSYAKEFDLGYQDILSDYISEHVMDILRISGERDARHGMEKDDGLLVLPEHMVRNRLLGRYEIDNKALYLAVTPFKSWCTEKQFHFGTIKKTLGDKVGAKIVNMRLGKGTNIPAPPTRALKIPFMDSTELGLTDDETKA